MKYLNKIECDGKIKYVYHKKTHSGKTKKKTVEDKFLYV